MITLVLGGARSGKSAVAERLAARLPAPVTYVATANVADPELDPDMAGRIAAHRARRSTEWRTLEIGGGRPPDFSAGDRRPGNDLAANLSGLRGSVLVDALGTWVAGCPDFNVDIAGLCRALSGRPGDSVVVSDEVGMGVHPTTGVGRRFRDVLGEVNQAVAAIADDVVLVVAGRILRLDPLP